MLNRNAIGQSTNEKCYTALYRISSQKYGFHGQVWVGNDRQCFYKPVILSLAVAESNAKHVK